MTEERWDVSLDDDEVEVSRPEPTGVRRVDAVLDGVARLGDQPLAEHVAVFEQAHDELRRTLDDVPDGASDVDPA